MHTRIVTIIGVLALLTGCNEEPVKPFYTPNQYALESSFFPLTYQGKDIFVGSDQVFINTKSFAVNCEGTHLVVYDGYLYLTNKFSAYIVDRETQTPKIEMSLSELFETTPPNKQTSSLIKDSRLLRVDGTFSNSSVSRSNQC